MGEFLHKEIYSLKNKEKAIILAGFFKTKKGQYGEGDCFLGVTVPLVRKIVLKYWQEASLSDCEKLLDSTWHEERLLALLVLVKKFENGNLAEKKNIFNLYLSKISRINNWDLVDLSADRIVGAYLENKPRKILFELADSANLWQKRIAMLATFHFIKKGDCQPALQIAEKLLFDKHDLIQKAVGWMLREIGKRCGQEKEEIFLQKYAAVMPRTTLRYAIERFEEEKKMYYMRIKGRTLLKHETKACNL
jgi:3-methyladenine DNA glycosylase AlkD